MKSPPGDRRIPDALQIAAYLDGELDRQLHLAPLRRRVQEWLLEHPEAGAAALAQRRLIGLMRATPAPEPTEAAWEQILAHLQELPAPTLPAQRPEVAGRHLTLVAVLMATAAAVGVALALWQWLPALDTTPSPGPSPVHVVEKPVLPPPSKVPQPMAPRKVELEPFPVATADEIEIIRIGGADVKTLVVGHVPVRGPLLLAEPGEITLTRAEPEVRMGEGVAPILWMRPAEEEKVP